MKDELPVDELEALAKENVGEALRRTRLFYNKSLEDIEKALRIRVSQIDAIERGDMTKLPGRAYAIGFVRTYAEHLGIDGATVVTLYKAQFMDGQDKADLEFPVPASETKTPAIWLAALGLVLASVVFLAYNALNKPDRTELMQVDSLPEAIKDHVSDEIIPLQQPVQEVVQEVDVAETSEEVDESVPFVEDMGAQDGTPAQNGIILNILGDCWVEIKDENKKVLVSNILSAGDQYFVPDSPGLSISVGNAANIEILVEGKTLKPLGGEGDVRRDIPLNMAYLKTLEFKMPEPESEEPTLNP